MDFVTHLSLIRDGYDFITTFLDRFTKRIHFISSKRTDSATVVAKCFFRPIFKLHGLPVSIVLEQDLRFTSKVCCQLIKCGGIDLKMSTNCDPQTDDFTEIMNRIIGNYLRCYSTFCQENWDKLLSSAEFAYNSAHVDSMRISPFELDLNWQPKTPLDVLMTHSAENVDIVNEFKTTIEKSLCNAMFAQRLAHALQAVYNAKEYTPPPEKVGDEVYLSQNLFSNSSSAVRPSQKLCVRKIGPFRVAKIINKNAIRVELPANIGVHPVIHVEQTARAYRQPHHITVSQNARFQSFIDKHGKRVTEIANILFHRKRGRGCQFPALARNAPSHEAEWKPLRDFVYADGTITAALHDYRREQGVLHHLH